MVGDKVSEHQLRDEEAWQSAQDAAKILTTIRKEITPFRIGLAGLVVFLVLALLTSGWYWMLPRDAVTVETQYLQRGGHLMMAEIHNDGSRTITDVEVVIEFKTIEGDLLDRMSIEVKSIASHSSVAGDDLELLVVGESVWDEYLIEVSLRWVDFSGSTNAQLWEHEVGQWSSEIFKDKAERSYWPLDA